MELVTMARPSLVHKSYTLHTKFVMKIRTIFKLKNEFVDQYKDVKPPFGFNGLGEIVYLRTYSRLKEDGTNEKWFETVRRVVEGTYTIQKNHIISNSLGWEEDKAIESAEEMYDRMFTMKFLPPGRGLWAMGTDIINDKGLFTALNNCAYYSTDNIDKEPTKPFEFMMDLSMLGVGVGFDTKGAGKVTIQSVKDTYDFVIPDTREGWVESLRLLLGCYMQGCNLPIFDYTQIRKEGEPIKTFGGKASGPAPLKSMHDQITNIFSARAGELITVTDIVDIMNIIGVCVVSGNVRRTAEIALGEYNDEEYLKLKDYKWNGNAYEGPAANRATFGWASNNSIFAKLGMDYTNVAKQTALNGEPGYAWLDNMQKYSRMNGLVDNKDSRVKGMNPCFTYATPILTPSGYKSIGSMASSIDKPDYYNFIDKKGKEVIGKVWSNGIKDTIAMHLSNNKTITCTKDHRFMLTDGTECEAQSIGNRRIMPFIELNAHENIYTALGFIQGDGCLSRLDSERHKGIEINIGDKDNDILKLFGLEMDKDNLKRAYYLTNYTEQLLSLGFSHKVLPERTLPSTYSNWSMTNKSAFLKGLYSANGSVIKDNRVSFKTTSKILATELQYTLLETFGITSYITTNKEKLVTFTNGTYLCKESYDLNIGQYNSILKFAKEINFVHTYKQEALVSLIKAKAPMVLSYKDNGEQEVFDFTLFNEEHWGVIDGLIAHNCGEQSLESGEMCCLVETFPTMCKDKEDYLRTLKFAYLYGKTVTLGNTHWVETNRVMLRNRRIGTSMSGIAQYVDSNGLEAFRQLTEEGYATIQKYDNIYSEWLAVPKSVKTTSIKPSGTVSLLPGVTPGMHYPESNYFIRRIRIAKNSDMISDLRLKGYKIEDSVTDNNTLIVEVPVHISGVRTINEVSMWEQLNLASFIQEHWADNQVSCTVTVKPNELNQIKNALDYYQYKLKAISFLPKAEKYLYAQMPYEEITEEAYNEMVLNINDTTIENTKEDSKPELFCDSDSCTIL